MSSEIRIAEVGEQVDTPEVSTTKPTLVPLRKVMENIREDSQRDSSEFLEDTVVPKGGE